MEKQILKLQKKTDKAFSLFHKIIASLLKHNIKLEKMLKKVDSELQEKRQEFLEKEENLQNHYGSIISLLEKNAAQIETLKNFVGKADE
jgi:Skp family chaperone for outer membrane proteins